MLNERKNHTEPSGRTHISMATPHIPQHSDNQADHTSMIETEIPPVFTDFDLYLFGQGKHYHLYEKMGAHLRTVNGVAGVNFAVWAPNAREVSVIGDFNDWNRSANLMHLRHNDLDALVTEEALASGAGDYAHKADIALLWQWAQVLEKVTYTKKRTETYFSLDF